MIYVFAAVLLTATIAFAIARHKHRCACCCKEAIISYRGVKYCSLKCARKEHPFITLFDLD
jgi:hypothetical protein